MVNLVTGPATPYVTAGINAGNDALAAKQKADQDVALKRLLLGTGPNGEAGLEAQSKIAENNGITQNSIAAAQKLQGMAPGGSGIKAGDISYTPDPTQKLMAQAPKEAKDFIKEGANTYKGINDQLDSTKGTLDALNMGNSTGDKLALINESRRALGGSGSKAMGQIVSLLSGDSTMAGDIQKAYNWLQNTPNIPAMTPAQRDAIRESVYGLLPQTEAQHKVAATQLMQHGAQMAPHADYQGIVSSFTSPAEAKLNELKQMQKDYIAQKSQMQGNPISNPAIANPNPTTQQGLMGFVKGLMGNGSSVAAPTSQTNNKAPMTFEEWKKANGR